MSITVRLWTKHDLEAVKNGDMELLTILANSKTFTNEMLRMFYIKIPLLNVYQCAFYKDADFTKIYAPDTEMLKWFLEQEYVEMPEGVFIVSEMWTEIEL